MSGNIEPIKNKVAFGNVHNFSGTKSENLNTIFPNWGGKFNAKIEFTKQSNNSNDCWLLTGINALNTTDWGRKILADNIKPDGKGGVFIYLPGAQGGSKKENTFQVTLEELRKASKSKNYSSGDDDVTAIELAVQKYLNKANNFNGNVPIWDNYTNFAFMLLTGKESHLFDSDDKNFDKAINEIEKNYKELAVECSFKFKEDLLYPDHAYTLVSMTKKRVELRNPSYSNKILSITRNEFEKRVKKVTILHDPNKQDIDFKSHLDIESEAEKIYPNISKYIIKKDDKSLKTVISQINKDNVRLILNKNSRMIEDLDKYKFGWSNGKEKKALIEPIINALAQHAKEAGVKDKQIAEFKKICIEKELNAKFYTNGATIQKEVAKMLDLINQTLAK